MQNAIAGSVGWLLLVVGCTGEVEAPGETGEPVATGSTGEPYEFANPCGEIVYHDLVFEGVVLGVGGQPASGVTVELQDFTFLPPPPLGTATSAAGGTFTFAVTNLKAYTGDCWGNGVIDYRVVATLGDASDEVLVNQPIFNSIYEEGDKVVELDTPPLRLE